MSQESPETSTEVIAETAESSVSVDRFEPEEVEERAMHTEETEFDVAQEVIAKKLETDLSCVADPGCELERKEGTREIFARDGKLFYQPESGYSIPVTKGEILTDGDWGISYHLDPDSVSQEFRSEYIKREAQRNISILNDRKIISEKIADPYLDAAMKEAYEEIRSRLESGALSSGELAEQMVHGLIEQVSLDMKGAGFEVIRATASDDVELKVDFAVRRTMDPKYRGVRIERGVQFTINTGNEAQVLKASQLKKVNKNLADGSHLAEVVLVTMSLKDVQALHAQWEKAGKPSGGPQRMWSTSRKEEIIRQVLGKHEVNGKEVSFLGKKAIDKVVAYMNKNIGATAETLAT